MPQEDRDVLPLNTNYVMAPASGAERTPFAITHEVHPRSTMCAFFSLSEWVVDAA